MKDPESFEACEKRTWRAGGPGFRPVGIPRRAVVLVGTLLGSWLSGGLCSAQVTSPAMKGCLIEVPNVFGACDGNPGTACTLHYEIWSDTYSAEVNMDVTGEPLCCPPQVFPPSTRPPNCCTGLSRPSNYPRADGAPGHDWFVQWFGELQPDSPDHIGYYAAQAQIVDPFDFGFAGSCDCRPIFPFPFPFPPPVACFPDVRPPGPPFPPGPHSVFRADGTEVEPLGPLSPIPIPRARLDKENLLIHLDWNPATGVAIIDGAADPIGGFQVWMAEDTNRDGIFPEPIPFPDYRPLARVPAGATSVAISILDLNTVAEAVHFALQILYRSTPSPLASFERRSGYTRTGPLPGLPGFRVEGLSANGNLVELGLLALIRNFSGVYEGGNRVRLSWEVGPAALSLDRFEVLVAKSAAGLDVGNIPAKLAGSTLVVPYDPAAGPNQVLSVVDGNAGRTGSKINLYVLRAVFANGTDAVSDPVVVDLTDILGE